MAFKTVLFVCAQALLLQSISGQCIGAGWGAAEWGAPWGAATWGGCGAGILGADLLAPATAAASHGGALPIASASPIPPNGVAVRSDNAYAGELAVRGALPFLGTVGLEGVLPTAGAAAVNYGCGNGAVAMLTEDIGAATIAAPLAAVGPLGYGFETLGYGIGTLGGCGCGRAALL